MGRSGSTRHQVTHDQNLESTVLEIKQEVRYTQKACNVVFKKELLIKGRTEIHVEKGADLSMGDSLSCLVWLDESARRNYWDRVGQCAGWGDIVVVTRQARRGDLRSTKCPGLPPPVAISHHYAKRLHIETN